jgi:predicted RNA binding protein YcfA (HicA-like mRNA interferase family)
VKTPRNVSGPELLKALRVLGYERIRQDGSHIRLTTRFTASSTSRFRTSSDQNWNL